MWCTLWARGQRIGRETGMAAAYRSVVSSMK
jgi:hypothetical protein